MAVDVAATTAVVAAEAMTAVGVAATTVVVAAEATTAAGVAATTAVVAAEVTTAAGAVVTTVAVAMVGTGASRPPGLIDTKRGGVSLLVSLRSPSDGLRRRRQTPAR